MFKQRTDLTDESAMLMIQAARKHALTIGAPQNIAVVDAGGRLLAFCRMPGAKFHSIDTSTAKAVTAASIAAPTGGAPDQFGVLLGITTQGQFTNLVGGLPVFIEGQLAGAIGVGSGSPDEDLAVAQAGIDALTKVLENN
ncbi:MAG: heme-binding protein [Granulosicoccus sp.]|nr:heme-binding protein [Granulosicoccus sp.]